MVEAFQNLIITVSDGNTVPSIDFLDTKTYPDIGSGTVFKISWNTPIATNNLVDYYKLYITAYDSELDVYQIVYDRSIGNVNEFFVTSSLLSKVDSDMCPLNIQLAAFSKYGTEYGCMSNIITVNVCRCCGTYIKVIDGYTQPVLKRAVACAKLDYVSIVDAEGKTLKGAGGKALYTKTAATQSSETGWSLMSDFFSKDSSGAWRASDVRYEVLTNEGGEIITDINNEPIYVL